MISFIVPAYNEETLIGATLIAVNEAAASIGEPFEVVVADDASTDRTATIAEANGARVVRVANRQIAATRNAGARAANGEFFIFVDADTVVNEAVLRAALRSMRDGAVGGGSAVRFDGRLPIYTKAAIPFSVWALRILRMAAGCLVFCTRQAFEVANGFDESMYGAEELAFSRALKRQGEFVVLRESVTTSGRKLRAYSGWKLLGVLCKLALRGPNAVRSRKGLEIWYEDRQPDPDADEPNTATKVEK